MSDISVALTTLGLTSSVLMGLYLLIGRKDPVLMKLIESEVRGVRDSMAKKDDLLAVADDVKDVKRDMASREDLRRVERKLDDLLKRLGE